MGSDGRAGRYRELLRRPVAVSYSSVKAARLAILDAVLTEGCGEEVALNAELAGSELVTNAIEHADSYVALRLVRLDDRVRLEVNDDGPGWPNLLAPTLQEPSGRGLLIVDQVSLGWGVDNGIGGGKSVWAEFGC